jgi:hypothetical protein
VTLLSAGPGKYFDPGFGMGYLVSIFKKLFFFVSDEEAKYAGAFAFDKPFQSCLKFAGNARTLP